MTIKEIRNLSVEKREQILQAGENTEKIDNVINFLKDDMCFFEINIDISVPILLYLGISEEKVEEVFFDLIDFKNFNSDKVRLAIDVNLKK